jgi:nucleoid DNA-binding protein
MDKKFNNAFREALRGFITEGKSVSVSGLGTFKPVHMKQHEAENEDGLKVLVPPMDTIEFTPEGN